MTMPDVIYAKIENYKDRGQHGSAKTWTEQDYKDDSEPYYNQSKVDELLDELVTRCADVKEHTKQFSISDVEYIVEMMKLEIGDSDE